MIRITKDGITIEADTRVELDMAVAALRSTESSVIPRGLLCQQCKDKIARYQHDMELLDKWEAEGGAHREWPELEHTA